MAQQGAIPGTHLELAVQEVQLVAHVLHLVLDPAAVEVAADAAHGLDLGEERISTNARAAG